MDQVVVCFRKEVIEEILYEIKQKHQRAGHDIRFFLTEYRPFPEQRAEFGIGEPDKKNGDDRAWDAHLDDIRSVLTLFAACVIDDVRANARKRNIYDYRDEIHDVHMQRFDPERIADQDVRCGQDHVRRHNGKELHTDAAARIGDDLLVRHVTPFGGLVPVRFDRTHQIVDGADLGISGCFLCHVLASFLCNISFI